jgi:hypothetical protein
MNDSSEEIQPLKERHGCLTAYLILMLIANSATALLYLFSSEAIRKQNPNMPDWAFPVLIAIGIINLVFAFALFQWKKWGFWGFVCTAVVVFFINIAIGINPVSALGGLLGIPMLFFVLQIGKEKKGWTQLG